MYTTSISQYIGKQIKTIKKIVFNKMPLKNLYINSFKKCKNIDFKEKNNKITHY